jgi:glycosyltransferase involved in cell wall biosynthesis
MGSKSRPSSTTAPWVYRGPVGGAARTKALGSACALLHFINFDEPFGLSVVEALACGTPVIASNRGSMPELVDPGVTGFWSTTSMEPWMRSAVSAKSIAPPAGRQCLSASR